MPRALRFAQFQQLIIGASNVMLVIGLWIHDAQLLKMCKTEGSSHAVAGPRLVEDRAQQATLVLGSRDVGDRQPDVVRGHVVASVVHVVPVFPSGFTGSFLNYRMSHLV